MKYEKPTVEIISFDNQEVFMTASGEGGGGGGGITHADVVASGLRECYSVAWAGRYSLENTSWPIIDCKDVVFGNGNRKNDRTYSVPCKTY